MRVAPGPKGPGVTAGCFSPSPHSREMIMTIAYDPRVEWAQDDAITLANVSARLSELVTALSVPDGGFTVDPRTGSRT